MAEEYQDRFQNIIKSGDAMFAMCLATDVGIFDALLKAAKPLTCKEIASEKQLKERYLFISLKLFHFFFKLPSIYTNKKVFHLIQIRILVIHSFCEYV